MAAFGDAFIAKRTVRPYALGNDSAVVACRLSVASSYTKHGVPTFALMSRHWSGFKKLSDSLFDIVGGVARRAPCGRGPISNAREAASV